MANISFITELRMDPLQSGLPRTANPPVAVSQSPQGLAIRDPGVLSTSQSFTEIEFENRHTAHIGIGKKNLFSIVGLSRDNKQNGLEQMFYLYIQYKFTMT